MLGAIAAASPTQLSVTAPVAVAAKIKSALSASDGDRLERGLAFRFKVKLDHVDTGDWSSCAGLKVDFKSEQIRCGGEYGSTNWLPVEAGYGKLVLRRAIEPKGSKKVQEWLKKSGFAWLSEAYDPKAGGGTGVVTLYDADNEAVMRWTLRDLRPASWSGPDLDASGNKVALETLELVHRGFIVDVMKHHSVKHRGDDPDKKADRLKIKCAQEPPGEIEFLYNPEKVVVGFSKGGGSGWKTNEDGSPQKDDTPADIRTYTIAGLNLLGTRTRKQADDLVRWAGKQPAPRGTPKKDTMVTVTWGNFFAAPEQTKKMVITDVAITYTRFDSTGLPIRAQVTTLKLRDWPKEAKGSANVNPTSGGLAGRRTHRLILGEDLAFLAQEYYGHGAYWRGIAAANGIDDPARVAPGTLLYLPAVSEFDTPGVELPELTVMAGVDG